MLLLGGQASNLPLGGIAFPHPRRTTEEGGERKKISLVGCITASAHTRLGFPGVARAYSVPDPPLPPASLVQHKIK